MEDLIKKDYSNTVFTSRLYDLFCKHDELIRAYIKVGRKFWDYDRGIYRKLTVTYIRTGVLFFVYDDKPETEFALYINSFRAQTLHAAQIYPNEIAELLSKYYTTNDFLEICKQCKWDDCDGRITVEVVWDN